MAYNMCTISVVDLWFPISNWFRVYIFISFSCVSHLTAFEAFWCESWQTVERLRIRDGEIRMHVTDDEAVIETTIPVSNLRIRSRKATVSDCTCFLRPGIDICVLSTSQHTENIENSGDENIELENPEPVSPYL